MGLGCGSKRSMREQPWSSPASSPGPLHTKISPTPGVALTLGATCSMGVLGHLPSQPVSSDRAFGFSFSTARASSWPVKDGVYLPVGLNPGGGTCRHGDLCTTHCTLKRGMGGLVVSSTQAGGWGSRSQGPGNEGSSWADSCSRGLQTTPALALPLAEADVDARGREAEGALLGSIRFLQGKAVPRGLRGQTPRDVDCRAAGQAQGGAGHHPPELHLPTEDGVGSAARVQSQEARPCRGRAGERA